MRRVVAVATPSRSSRHSRAAAGAKALDGRGGALRRLATTFEVDFEGNTTRGTLRRDAVNPAWEKAMTLKVTEYFGQAPIVVRLKSVGAWRNVSERGAVAVPLSEALPARIRVEAPAQPVPVDAAGGAGRPGSAPASWYRGFHPRASWSFGGSGGALSATASLQRPGIGGMLISSHSPMGLSPSGARGSPRPGAGDPAPHSLSARLSSPHGLARSSPAAVRDVSETDSSSVGRFAPTASRAGEGGHEERKAGPADAEAESKGDGVSSAESAAGERARWARDMFEDDGLDSLPDYKLDGSTKWWSIPGTKAGELQLTALYIPNAEICALMGPEDEVRDDTSGASWTSLHRAASQGELVLLSALAAVAHRADKLHRRTRDASAVSALDIACARGNLGAVKALLSVTKHAVPLSRSPGALRTCLHFAVLSGNTMVVTCVASTMMRQHRIAERHRLADPMRPASSTAAPNPLDLRDARGYTALAVAASKGQLGILKVLASFGASLSSTTARGDTPLLLAIANGHTDVALHLLTLTASAGHVKQWLARPMSRNIDGVTPLMAATRAGDVRVVRGLVDIGVPRASATNAGTTALHIAAAAGDVACARILTLQDERSRTKVGSRLFRVLGESKQPADSAASASAGQSADGAAEGAQEDAAAAGDSGDGGRSSCAAGAAAADEGKPAPEAAERRSGWIAMGRGIGDDGRGRVFSPASESVRVKLVDACGRTPRDEAERGDTPGHTAVAQLLARLERAEAGAQVTYVGNAAEAGAAPRPVEAAARPDGASEPHGGGDSNLDAASGAVDVGYDSAYAYLSETDEPDA